MKKRTLLTLGLASATVLGGGLFAVANAASGTPGNLAQKIASTFHLDATKVQAVIDENHSANQTKRETTYEDELNAAVTAGKLTPAQKALVLTEHAKLETERTAAMAKTGTDRQAALKAIKTEAKTWSKANGIDTKWLLGGRHLRGGHTMASPTTTPGA